MNVRNLDSIKKDDDIFFYLGIPISKNYFSKERVAEVCDKLNGIKYQFFQESTISKIRMKKTITGLYPIMDNPNIFLFCSVSKELYLGLYNVDTKIFLPATDILLKKMNDTYIYEFANIMNKTAKRIQSELITETMCKDMEILSSWKKYIEQIKSHPNNFQHTYQVCFTCNLGKIITSDEELRQAIKRKELLIREEKEEVKSRE